MLRGCHSAAGVDGVVMAWNRRKSGLFEMVAIKSNSGEALIRLVLLLALAERSCGLEDALPAAMGAFIQRSAALAPERGEKSCRCLVRRRCRPPLAADLHGSPAKHRDGGRQRGQYPLL
jgi:hypothetical protein